MSEATAVPEGATQTEKEPLPQVEAPAPGPDPNPSPDVPAPAAGEEEPRRPFAVASEGEPEGSARCESCGFKEIDHPIGLFGVEGDEQECTRLYGPTGRSSGAERGTSITTSGASMIIWSPAPATSGGGLPPETVSSMHSMYIEIKEARDEAQEKAEKAFARAEHLEVVAGGYGRQMRTMEALASAHGIVLNFERPADSSSKRKKDEDQPELPGLEPEETVIEGEDEDEDAEGKGEGVEPDPIAVLGLQIQTSNRMGTCMYHPELPRVGEIELATLGRPKVGACQECWDEYQAAQAARQAKAEAERAEELARMPVGAPAFGTLFSHGQEGQTWRADPSSPTGMRWYNADGTAVDPDAGPGPVEAPGGGPAEAPAETPASSPAGPAEAPAGGPKETKTKKERAAKKSPMEAGPAAKDKKGPVSVSAAAAVPERGKQTSAPEPKEPFLSQGAFTSPPGAAAAAAAAPAAAPRERARAARKTKAKETAI